MPALLIDDEISSATTSSPTSATSILDGFERPRKPNHQGSIMSIIRTLTHSGAFSPCTGCLVFEKSPERHRLFKKMSLPFLRGQFGGTVTVIHRVKKKSRPSVRSIERAADKLLPVSAPAILSVSDTNSTTNSSGKSSGPTNGTGTTVATSIESKLSGKDSDPVQQRSASIVHHRDPDASPTMVDPGLTTIQEKPIDPPPPTILTVERTAAAKIYLETYFNDKLSRPSPRSLRRRYLESELYHGPGLSQAEKDMRRALFCQQETNHLRETRVLAARSLGAIRCEHGELADNYEVLKILGKGSFGVVRLVREKPGRDSHPRNNRVYAMKVIRKSAMLKTSQEGHLRAERDFLVASEGSRWIVPLIASFQDAGNLYLVMDYMPGGDFLGLLIRENILSEPVAKFYIAEMILCIEEAHSLRCIHRDIKPDNFLISSTGHLKISDFGLAFDGHWSHDTSYYHTQRYSLLHKLGLAVEGDATDRAEGLQGTMKWAQGVTQAMQKHAPQPAPPNATSAVRDEPLLNWRNRCGNRSAARSCVGTSQYMAPECLYGHTPFLSEEGGRQQTKRNIVNHEQTFAFPPRPVVSRRCMDLIANLVCARENRLSSKRYQARDAGFEQHQHPFMSSPARSRARPKDRDGRGRSVYPHDAEDIKAHKWFRDIPWDQLCFITPPFVPRIAGVDDTHYFDEEEPISDWSDSDSEDDDDDTGSEAKLATFPRHLQGLLAQFVATPYDTTRLKRMDREINALTATASAPSNNNNAPPMAQAQPQQQVQFQEVELGDQMKAFIRTFGRRERKRPRDRLLRDRKTKATVLKVRKQTAFLGYTYRRVMDGADDDDDGDGVPQHRSCNSVVVNNGNGNTLDANIDNNIVLVPSTLDGVEKMPSPRMYLHPGLGGVEEQRE
ncbi:kinase-like domain-containing protein [Xylaria bambusicola]|uniref:kinase-like domain-containing protein n=1 Tax=Xylaria bambusicola TaxID=326684 RepID=UPI0020086B99|nr:kinase-like domain-containing protein [Xylaria bambusicola]KAI0512461.1 kinase-like domain-containing protein [Xylaria bambusicola]